MNFNDHSELNGRHAFLSPSNYHWINYNDQKLEARFFSYAAARHGTDLHEWAHQSIRLERRQPQDTGEAICAYVNDGIDYRMRCEQGLFYSPNCFGHADTISFHDNLLRIHDLKTGVTATSEKQLEVYAALFCLEYAYDPFDILIELRIYQREEVRVFQPYGDPIAFIMDKIVLFDQQIQALKEEDRW